MCGENLDNVGTNSFQLILMFDFIAGAIFIPFVIKCKTKIPLLIALVGQMISIVVLLPLCKVNLDNVGTNAYQLIMFVDIVSLIIIVIRSFKKNKGE